jgi:hypothetical protein
LSRKLPTGDRRPVAVSVVYVHRGRVAIEPPIKLTARKTEDKFMANCSDTVGNRPSV